MKKFLLSLFVCAASLTALADDRIMVVYLQDGTTRSFYESELDSIVYSKVDLDGQMHDHMVTQEVWTGDSVYRLPIEMVDSLGHANVMTYIPPTVTERGQGETTEDFSYSMPEKTIFMREDVSNDLLSYNRETGIITFANSEKIQELGITAGDILYSTERTGMFPDGYCLKVVNVAQRAVQRRSRTSKASKGPEYTLEVVTEQSSITEAFASFDGSVIGAGSIASMAIPDIYMTSDDTNITNQEGDYDEDSFNWHVNFKTDKKQKIKLETDGDNWSFTYKDWTFSYNYATRLTTAKYTICEKNKHGVDADLKFTIFYDWADKDSDGRGIIYKDQIREAGSAVWLANVNAEASVTLEVGHDYIKDEQLPEKTLRELEFQLANMPKKIHVIGIPIPMPPAASIVIDPALEIVLELGFEAKNNFMVSAKLPRDQYSLIWRKDSRDSKTIFDGIYANSTSSTKNLIGFETKGKLAAGISIGLDIGLTVGIPMLRYGKDFDEESYVGFYIQPKFEADLETDVKIGGSADGAIPNVLVTLTPNFTLNALAQSHVGFGESWEVEAEISKNLIPKCEFASREWSIPIDGYASILNKMPFEAQHFEPNETVHLEWNDYTQGLLYMYEVYVGTTNNITEMKRAATIYAENTPSFVPFYDYTPYSEGKYYWCVKAFTRAGTEVRSRITTFVVSRPDYVDLGLPSGTLWASYNVGAYSPTDMGTYFAWGEVTPKDVYELSTYAYYKWTNFWSAPKLTKYCPKEGYAFDGIYDNLTTLQPQDDAATVNWGDKWRMPTPEEFDELFEYCDVSMVKEGDVEGLLVVGPKMKTAPGTPLYVHESIFLPAAGYRDGATTAGRGQMGCYWTNRLADDPSKAYYKAFIMPSSANTKTRYYGQSIRPVYQGKLTYIENLQLLTHRKEMRVGSTFSLDCKYFPENTTQKGTLWKSSNEVVATVNNGQVVAVGEGVCIISVMSDINYRMHDECIVVVSNGDFPTTDVMAFPFSGIDYGFISVGLSSTEELEIYNTLETNVNLTLKVEDNQACFKQQKVSCMIPSRSSRKVAVTFAPEKAGKSTTILTAKLDKEGSQPFQIATLTGEGIDHGPTTGYVDLGLPSGTLWAQCNLGASTPEEIGSYYAWGEIEPYGNKKSLFNWANYKYCKGTSTTLTKYCPNSNYGYQGYYDQLRTLKNEDDAAFMNKGGYWRMPTNEQWNELIEVCSWSFLGDRAIVRGPNGNIIALPLGGNREGSNLFDKGTDGYYWSSTVDDVAPDNAWYLYISKGGTPKDYDYSRCHGRCIRPVYVKDEPQFPFLAPQRRLSEESSKQSGQASETRQINDGGVVMTIGHATDAVTK